MPGNELEARVIMPQVAPWLRRKTASWSRGQAALASLGTFLVGICLAIVIATAAAMFCDALRLDTRGGI
jgi:hypothetical protein